MKIAVFSDSHGDVETLKQCMDAARPDVMIHLGDYVEDGRELSCLHPEMPSYRVGGNCDIGSFEQEELLLTLPGITLFLCHGHTRGVKMGDGGAVTAALYRKADVLLYGHTHRAVCRREQGMWVMNPGACRGKSPTYGIVELEAGKIVCYTATL